MAALRSCSAIAHVGFVRTIALSHEISIKWELDEWRTSQKLSMMSIFIVSVCFYLGREVWFLSYGETMFHTL